MKLSIITVNLNNRSGLKKTIQSVIHQTFTDYEWIVIDGASTDGSVELIKQYSYLFKYWISEPDNGVYQAMNKGVSYAKGEYVQFLNSGDWLYDSNTLSQVFSKHRTSDILYGDVINVINGKYSPHKFPNKVDFYYFINQFINHQATFIKGDIYRSHRFEESLKIYADWDLCMALLFEEAVFEHINQYIVYYDCDGISSHITKEHIIEHEKILNQYVYRYVNSNIINIEKAKIDFIKMYKYEKGDLVTFHGCTYDIEHHKSYRIIMSFATKMMSIFRFLINQIEKKRQ